VAVPPLVSHGAAVRLRHGERAAQLAGGHPRQVALLLVAGAVLEQQVGDDEVRVDDPGDAHPAAGDLLDGQRVGQQGLAEAAVLFGDGQAEQPHLAHGVDDLLRVLVVVFQPLGVRDDLPVRELPHGGDDLPLDVGEPFCLRQPTHYGRSTRSKTAASPWPPPMHMVSSPYRAALRPISRASVARIRVPVAPTGWPSDMPEP